jgi:hypothetical protein
MVAARITCGNDKVMGGSNGWERMIGNATAHVERVV